jgi:YGGT family
METMNSYNSPSTKSLFRGTQVSWYLIGLLEALLGFRFVLKLTGANPAAGFTDLIYSVTWPFVAPFSAVFPRTVVEGSTFEWTTLLAMAVYYIIALAIIQLFMMSKTVSTPEAAAKLDEQERKEV